ncbi:MAG: hypothetical protein FJ315_01665 [SAR202 cluster bacterium]|nr:hypothetical protein [SAR202 cluster bacterium]
MSNYLGATAVAQPPVGADAGCKHFWLIDTPNGPVSRGVCKVCGLAKEFKNYLDTTPYWEDEPTAVGAADGRRLSDETGGALDEE